MKISNICLNEFMHIMGTPNAGCLTVSMSHSAKFDGSSHRARPEVTSLIILFPFTTLMDKKIIKQQEPHHRLISEPIRLRKTHAGI